MAVAVVNKHTVSYMRNNSQHLTLWRLWNSKRGFALWSDDDKLPHEVLNINAIQNFSRSSLKL